MVQIIREVRRIARRGPRCSLCWRTIGKGEDYRCSTNVYDGRIYNWNECAHCEAFRKLTDYWGIDLAWSDEGYSSDTVEEFEPRTAQEVKLLKRWRRRWRRKDGSLYQVPTEA